MARRTGWHHSAATKRKISQSLRARHGDRRAKVAVYARKVGKMQAGSEIYATVGTRKVKGKQKQVLELRHRKITVMEQIDRGPAGGGIVSGIMRANTINAQRKANPGRVFTTFGAGKHRQKVRAGYKAGKNRFMQVNAA